MGRGTVWTAQECPDLARAWLNVTQVLIDVIDQISANFWQNLFASFSSATPSDATENNTNLEEYFQQGQR